MAKEKFECEHCSKDCENQYTRQGFRTTYFVEWVCEKCFEELEGCSFEEYGVKDTVEVENEL